MRLGSRRPFRYALSSRSTNSLSSFPPAVTRICPTLASSWNLSAFAGSRITQPTLGPTEQAGLLPAHFTTCPVRSATTRASQSRTHLASVPGSARKAGPHGPIRNISPDPETTNNDHEPSSFTRFSSQPSHTALISRSKTASAPRPGPHRLMTTNPPWPTSTDSAVTHLRKDHAKPAAPIPPTTNPSLLWSATYPSHGRPTNRTRTLNNTRSSARQLLVGHKINRSLTCELLTRKDIAPQTSEGSGDVPLPGFLSSILGPTVPRSLTTRAAENKTISVGVSAEALTDERLLPAPNVGVAVPCRRVLIV